MARKKTSISPESFTTFGDLLRYLRTRVGLSQRDLAAQVGYHYSHLNRFEKNQRVPDPSIVLSRFAPALQIEEESLWIARLIELASTKDPGPISTKLENGTNEVYIYRLPHNLTPMLGRKSESIMLTKLLLQPEVRLLTLIGPPGVGKTHTALHVAEKISNKFLHGALLVNLIPVENAEDVLHSIADALGLLQTSTTPGLRMLQSFLQNKNLLIVVDNFEQVLAAAPQLNELLAAAPQVKILATSREALRIQGEREFPLLPLPTPNESQFGQLDIFDEFPAVQLFLQRAVAVKPDFQLTDQNASLVAEICFRLDGLPLAIELAASRVQTLSLAEMLAQFDRLFDWLTRGRRDTPEWRQTLLGAIEWSYNLLTEAERLLLARLSVFSGSWTLESAEAICSDDDLLKRNKILQVLSQLVDRSLIVVDFGRTVTRYRFLDTIFHFAQSKLNETEQSEQLHNRHLDYFSSWAVRYAALIEKESPVHLRSMMDMESNNIRVALEWGLNYAINNRTLDLVSSAGLIWLKHSHFKESLEWVIRYLPLSVDHPDYHLRLLFLATALSYWRDNLKEALVYALLGEKIAGSTDNKFELAGILYYLGDIYRESDNLEKALQCIETSIILYREIGNSARLSLALTSRGIILYQTGDRTRARSSIEESLKIALEVNNLWSQSYALRVQADNLRFDGDYAASYDAYGRALVISVDIDDRISMGMELANMALLANVLDNYSASSYYATRALSLFQAIGNEYQQPFPLRMLAYACIQENKVSTARAYCMDSLKGNHALGHKTGVIACLVCLVMILYAENNISDAHNLFDVIQTEIAVNSISLMEPDAKALAGLKLDLPGHETIKRDASTDLTNLLNSLGIS